MRMGVDRKRVYFSAKINNDHDKSCNLLKTTPSEIPSSPTPYPSHHHHFNIILSLLISKFPLQKKQTTKLLLPPPSPPSIPSITHQHQSPFFHSTINQCGTSSHIQTSAPVLWLGWYDVTKLKSQHITVLSTPTPAFPPGYSKVLPTNSHLSARL